MDKNCNMRTGFQNTSYWMRAAKRFSALIVALIGVTLAGCGEPGLPGLGEVTVSGGADQEFARVRVSAGVCDFSLLPYFVRLFVTKEDADLGQNIFGSDTLLDIQDGPANTELLTNADIVISQVSPAFEIFHSTVPTSTAFDNPANFVDTTNGIAQVNTGSDGVSFLMIRTVPGFGVGAGFTGEYTIYIQPILGNTGIQVDLSFDCQEP